ncbi:hypothetical protein [Allostreptomyces psammosilenae]|uniref:Uncharacterized protein n=1 Tax=Allostreptomyces psammosilenae TaxID=1892865 RepID=A0A852ZT91_9ACTN|nr:hypothetical protein [Allostreptomyces psammosilenae]NYI04490.1 hypothetical protein [Allostreptomyces psammosilenae]
MKDGRAGTTARWLAGAVVTAVACGLPVGTAHADETHTDSHNAPTVALISTGQIDDPMEDVLEHVSLGDGQQHTYG